MRILLIALLTLWLVGCGKQQSQSEPTFEQYIDEFISDAHAYGRYPSSFDIIVKFDKLQDGGHGLYYDYYIPPSQTGQIPTILIKKAWWDTVSPSDRSAAMHHILAHRLLNREHRIDIEHQACDPSADTWHCKSFMQYPFPTGAMVEADKADYLGELFLYQQTPAGTIPTTVVPD